MKLYYDEIGNVVGSKDKIDLDKFNSDPLLDVLGRFIEGLLLNETVTITVNGPAVEVAALVYWFGQSGLYRLIEENAIEFFFCPGTSTYISKEKKEKLSLKSGPGLLWVRAENKEYKEPDEAIHYALTKQLNYPRGKAKRVGKRILQVTNTPIQGDNDMNIAEQSYKIACNILSEEGEEYTVENLKALNDKENKMIIRMLMRIASLNRDLKNAASLGCSNIYGNDASWEIVTQTIKPSAHIETFNKFNKLLEFEGVPCISDLVKSDWDRSNVFKLRTDSKIKDFRDFMMTLPSEPDKDILRGYYEAIKDKSSNRTSTKLLRVGIPGLIVLAGPIGSLFGTLVSGMDSFFGDRLINGWNPKMFIDKYFRDAIESNFDNN